MASRKDRIRSQRTGGRPPRKGGGDGAQDRGPQPDIQDQEQLSQPQDPSLGSMPATPKPESPPASPQPVPSTRYPARSTHRITRSTRKRSSKFVHPSEEEFARILDFYHIDWVYEPKSFPLRWEGDRVTEMFTPDFYLPDMDLYVELTTMKQSLVTRKNRKLRAMRDLYPDVNVRLLYRKDYQDLLAKYGYRAITPTNLDEIERVLFSSSKIQKRIGELAEQISQDYAGKELRMIGILKGVAFFMTDLMRKVTVPVSTDYMFISKYARNGAESGAVRILKDLDLPIEGTHLLLVEDIVDTGFTLRYILNYLKARNPASLKVCALLDKRARRLVEVPLDYVAFEIADEFVVGYGLDHRELYRNLPYVCVLKPESYGPETVDTAG